MVFAPLISTAGAGGAGAARPAAGAHGAPGKAHPHAAAGGAGEPHLRRLFSSFSSPFGRFSHGFLRGFVLSVGPREV